MSQQDPTLNELSSRVETLEARWIALDHAESERWTPDKYLRYERIPRLTGDVIHDAGSDKLLVPAERFRFQNPTNGVGNGAIQVDQGEDETILDYDGIGVLIAIGIVVSKYTAVAGAADVWIDITIDGGTTESFQIVFADRVWGKTMQCWVTVGDVPQSGDVDGHAMQIPIGVPFGSNVTVALRSNVTSAFTGEYDIAGTVIIAPKVV